jgi:hypothetical protein
MNKITKRIKAALRTNEPQASTVILMTVLSLFAALSGTRALNPYLVAFSVLLWPAFAFIANLVDPIPESKNNE